jgi:zinc transporter, ZIP family
METEELIWMLVPGFATGIGGLALYAVKRPSRVGLDVMLGFTAGVMLAATAFSLLVPALDEGGIGEVIVGFAIGAVVLLVLDIVLPHAHARLGEHGHRPLEETASERRAALLLTALTIHNVPEGLAVGVAFAAGGTDLGVPIALAIAIQNVPEGFAAAAPLIGAGFRRRTAVHFAALTGLVEPPAALLAFAAFAVIGGLLPVGLGFAAGAMLYVVIDELIPESHASGNEREASIALLGGFALMLALDTGLA